ncbi:extracellular solute-binding protein [Cohnella silvisoli]|uniref:Extracellular solute-binding protein n=1 Tax=Cohnella silvisoli TaxID=2873699 RepID=A0ABV1L4F7_9BACL|nr:extracellular solute-binding protein [Cohnella silvisoli]MCD9026174.1 extracellular solute-binding protein [Cohnella silvisoli]
MKRKVGKKIAMTVVFIVLVAAILRLFLSADEDVFVSQVSADDLLDYSVSGETVPYVKLKRTTSGGDLNPVNAFAIDGAEYASASEDADIELKRDGQPALYWQNDDGWVEWTADVPATGAYRLEIDYLPLPGSYSNVVRGLQIDGKTPFVEAENLTLERYWKDAKFPYDRNAIGQEIRPVQTEIEGWRTTAAANYAASSQPLQFTLTKGLHRFRLIGQKEPVAIRSLRWVPVTEIPDYDAYKKTKPDTKQPDWYEVIEAEQYLQKSNTSIQTNFTSEPHISPDPKGRIVYNVLGGDRWRNPGDWVEWKMDVPTDGWYVLDLKFYQGYRGDFKAFRTLMIDGVVPFRQMLHYALPANDNFEIASFQDDNGHPYRFYMTKGKHTLRLISDASPMQPALLALRDILDEVNELDLSISKITGNYGKGRVSATLNLDTQRTWDLLKYDPELVNKIKALSGRFSQVADYINGINQHKTDITDAIEVAVDMLTKMANDVNGIPNRVMDFSVMQNNIGTWLAQLNYQSVMLDYIVVRTPDTKTGLKSPTKLERIPYAALNFARTFYQDYDTRKLNKANAITVWVQRGRDYAELLREMIDTDFTPRTGIEVNVNLMPNPNQLILGNAAGDQPDIALGVGMETAVDYAMRDAVVDLSGMPEFDEVFRRFNPGAMRSFAYGGGTYALPEVQNFYVLYYRTDIFEQLKLEAPDTWDDVYKMLPTLQENGMTMYYPTKDFTPFFYQNDAEFYTSDGLTNNLGSANALKAFKQWTDLYTKYYLPLEAPAFFNHFRNGDIPIGIADFNTYLQLQVAAPEITGKWKIAPVPGIRQPDGEVARWTAQGLSGAMIMKKSDKQDQAWKFLKWWTSDQVQSQYGNDMESYYGLEYRWNTANLNAFETLSWPSRDIRVIKEQGRWVKNVPYVPGYYFLAREMDFAWIRTVVEGKPAKESLEETEVSLQREMQRRQDDFGITNSDNLQVPAITEPFNWGSGAP